MRRLRHVADSDVAVGDTVTVDYDGNDVQFVVEDVHMGEVCGTVTSSAGEDEYQCFTKQELRNIVRGPESVQDAETGTDGEVSPEGASGGDNPFQPLINTRVRYEIRLPNETNKSVREYPEGTVTKTGFDGKGWYGILRTDRGKEYTVREDEINKLKPLE